LFDEDELGLRPPFQYPVVCRRSGRRLVLLAASSRILDRLLSDNGGVSNDLRLSKIPIAVDALVKSISRDAGRYSLSFIHARISSSSSSLRSVSFYGDDVTQSRLFKDHSDDLNCYGCGLRHEVYGFEAARLGSDGAVSCASSGQTRLRQLEAALTFVSSQGFLRERKP
jgi:hypothetical protein